MNHDEVMELLERERVSYPDELPGERLAACPAERIAGRRPAYTPITEERAARNRARLVAAIRRTR